MDPIIVKAAEKCGLHFLLQLFPSEFTMWIEPREVSYRIGGNGLTYVLYEYKENVTELWKPECLQSDNKTILCCI